MRRRVWFAVMGGPAAFGAAVLACSSDDTSSFPGVDATADVPYDKQAADFFVPDLHVDPAQPFEEQVALAYCTRMQTCCGVYDGGTFDFQTCLATTKASGWAGFTTGLAVSGVKDGKHVSVDMTSAQACLGGLATLSCPLVGSTEFKNVTLACSKAVRGTQTAGGDCLASIECGPDAYCAFLDGGTVGRCAPLFEAGAGCGSPPYGASSDECAHLSGPNPPLFCDHGAGSCAGLRANDQTCLSDNECQSGICTEVDAGPSCADAGCGCQLLLDLRYRVCGVPYPPPPEDGGDAGDAGDAD